MKKDWCLCNQRGCKKIEKRTVNGCVNLHWSLQMALEAATKALASKIFFVATVLTTGNLFICFQATAS